VPAAPPQLGLPLGDRGPQLGKSRGVRGGIATAGTAGRSTPVGHARDGDHGSEHGEQQHER
jgi:hypothetical protein